MTTAPQPPAKPATPPPSNAKHADPQEAKLEGHAVPPHWQEPKAAPDRPAFTPKAALDPRAEKAPAGAYGDGMTIAEEQRARSAWIEQHGLKDYHEATDQRSEDEKAKKQIPGVTPPTKRE